MVRKIGYIFFLAFLYFFSESRTDGFRTTKIIFNFNNKNYSNKNFEDYEKIFSQKFTYLGRGRQFFVFESEDKKYVIKFINYNNICPIYILKKFSFINFVKKSIERKNKRYPLTFGSIKLAFNRLKDEAAIIYIHLNDMYKIKKKIQIISKYGQPFKIDLDKTVFFVQKKIDPIYPSLERCYMEGGEELLKKRLNNVLDLFILRAKKCVSDDDLNVETNIGFIKDKAKIIDIGKLFKDDKLKNKKNFKKEILKSTKFLRLWVKKKYPSISFYLDKEIEEKTKNLF
ncbi:MAG: hypothetical protein AMS24_03890 [Chlamydiae bacterium SM23_39]|nr:MAG: hypothetical protein AMS24_03890 [Chlamydiae bacterium SM23_39]